MSQAHRVRSPVPRISPPVTVAHQTLGRLALKPRSALPSSTHHSSHTHPPFTRTRPAPSSISRVSASCRASPRHRSREDGLAHPADTSTTNQSCFRRGSKEASSICLGAQSGEPCACVFVQAGGAYDYDRHGIHRHSVPFVPASSRDGDHRRQGPRDGQTPGASVRPHQHRAAGPAPRHGAGASLHHPPSPPNPPSNVGQYASARFRNPAVCGSTTKHLLAPPFGSLSSLFLCCRRAPTARCLRPAGAAEF